MRVLKEIILSFNPKMIVFILLGNLALATLPVLCWHTYSRQHLENNSAFNISGDTFQLLMDHDADLFGTLGPFRGIISTRGLARWMDMLEDGVLPTTVVISMVLYSLFWVFLYGAILSAWQKDQPLSLWNFGADGLRLFPKNFVLLAAQCIIIFILYQLVIVQGYHLVASFSDSAPSEWMYLLLHWIPVVLFGILLLLVKFLFDFARVAIAQSEPRSFFVSLFDGFGAAFHRLPSTFLYFLTLTILALGVSVIWHQVACLIPGIAFRLLGQEIFMAVMIWFSLAWWKGLIHVKENYDLSI